jgi:hypothetical protein
VAQGAVFTHGGTLSRTHVEQIELGAKCRRPGLQYNPDDKKSLQAVCNGAAGEFICPVRALCLRLGTSTSSTGVYGGVRLDCGKPYKLDRELFALVSAEPIPSLVDLAGRDQVYADILERFPRQRRYPRRV